MSGKQVWIPSNNSQQTVASQENQQTTTTTSESVPVDSNANSNTPRSNAPRGSSRGRGGRGRGNNRKPKEPATSHSQVNNNNDEQPTSESSPSQPKPKPKRNPRKPKNKTPNVNNNVNTTTSTGKTEETDVSNTVEIKHSKSGKVPPLIKPKPQQQPADTHSSLATNIIERLESNTYECMICTDTIRRQVTVWSCSNCYALFHLYCVKKWSKSAEDQGTRASPWRCPGCQYVYVTKPIPKCYCGKTMDPPYNPYLLPHSCGEICGKSRSGDCPHPCNLICHPGHCPPCSAVGPLKHCYCGNTSYRLRCGQKDPGKTCGETCDHMLNCNIHKCKEICHEGKCKPCVVMETQICYCGKVKEERSCGSGQVDTTFQERRNFSCAQKCDRKLACGNHVCEKTCHKGLCEQCPMLPTNVTTCPCGKIPLELLTPKLRTSCLDPIPTCPNTCGKLLLCGKHTCPSKCHSGPCPQCSENVKAPCRCHGTYVTVPCHQVNGQDKTLDKIICNKLCKAKRICTRHDCGNQCCPSAKDPYDMSGSHICNLICNKKLRCGKHLCDLLCHSGRCPPCHITQHEQYVCECGFTTMQPPIMCGTKLPECPKVCVRSRPCGHVNNHPCHSRDSSCPPCTAPTEKPCMGGHENKKYVPCNVSSVSCGRTCGKMLVCGVHPCKRVCHGDACQPVTDTSCGQLCARKRELCEHRCMSACHGDKPCPKNPCRDLIRISCPCKRRSVEVECLRGGETDTKDNTGARELMCDEQCAVEARNRKLAEAFGISLDRNTGSIYPDILLQLGKANREFVMRTEKRFEDLVKSAATRASMPPMDRVQRRMVHEMAKFYQLDTESYDKEPNRTVTVTKRKESKIPQPLLSVAIAEYMRANQPNAVPVSANTLTTYYGLLVSDAISQGALLQSFMAPFAGDYHIKWIDNDALIAFTDINAMKTALFVLAGGPFQVKEYKEKIEIEVEPKKTKVKSVKPFSLTAPTPEWCKDSNFFTSLYNMEQEQQKKEEQPVKKEDASKKSTWADLEEQDAKQEVAWTEEKPEVAETTTATTLPSYENWESAENEVQE